MSNLMRDALERIANHEPKDDWSWYELRDIAREALQQEAFDRAPVGAQTDHGPKLGETGD